MNINLPPKTPGGVAEVLQIEAPARIVIVGANGSGKTRFGVFLDDNNTEQVHRISAQKVLTIPEFAGVKNLEQAQKDVLYGRFDEHASRSRSVHDRFQGDAAMGMLSDFEKVISLLFAMNADRDRLHTEDTRRAMGYVPVPDSPIDQIIAAWAYLMPHRPISFRDGRVLVAQGAVDAHHAKGMSDGERVTLYLLGQCICAQPGTMLIIDEPELHLHKALVDKMWNKVEEICSDKILVYITHDLEFAASRVGAKKIWVKSLESLNNWFWVDLPEDENIPEALIMEVLGSRKPILFCEGEKGKLDHTIYQRCFPHLHVVPRGGCAKVIEATKALNDNATLHAYQPLGLIDRDVRTEEEVSALHSDKIHVLSFAEVENLLCVEGLIRLVAVGQHRDPDEMVNIVTEFVRKALLDELDAQVAMRAADRVRFHLSGYSSLKNNEVGVQAGVDVLLSTLDVAKIYRDSKEFFDAALRAGDLNKLLAVYNRKSLSARISNCFGFKVGEYNDLILRMLSGSDSSAVTAVLKPLLPAI